MTGPAAHRMGYQTVDELTTNQITAALYERSRLLQRAIRRLESQAPSVDRNFAMACNEFALLHTNRALLEVSRRVPEPEQNDPVTAGKAALDAGWQDYHRHQALGPVSDREGDPAFNGAFSRW